MNKRKTYYIQSKPPERDFLHHSHFVSLKKSLKECCLKEGRPYKGISLTTDPGRFLSPMPMLGTCVDGFIDIPAKELIEEMVVIPCLYHTTEETLLDKCRKEGYNVYNEIPLEYKYITRFTLKNEIFLGENEWLYFSPQMNIWGCNVYITKNLIKRFVKGLSEDRCKLVKTLEEYRERQGR